MNCPVCDAMQPCRACARGEWPEQEQQPIRVIETTPKVDISSGEDATSFLMAAGEHAFCTA